MTLSVCNKDCFNCPFPDCVNDDLDHDDYKALAELDKELTSTPKKKKLAAANRAYREANKDKLAAANRAYREANKDKVAAAQRVIKDVRARLGLSQRAAAAILGVSQPTLSLWENGLAPCDAAQVIGRMEVKR